MASKKIRDIGCVPDQFEAYCTLTQRLQVVFTKESNSTLNSYGYSPHPLATYLEWVFTLLTEPTTAGPYPLKPIIISITESSPSLLADSLLQIHDLRKRLQRFHAERQGPQDTTDPSTLVAVELNTSCPNIPNKPPPSYDPVALATFVAVLALSFQTDPSLTIGLKLPPYLYATQFRDVLDVIGQHLCQAAGNSSGGPSTINPIAYLACTNTLGSSMLLSGQVEGQPDTDPFSAALPTTFGGLAGESIHPLALGNVHAFSQLIKNHPNPALRDLKIIGIGGVSSAEAASRMQNAGAHVVGCASFLGRHGVAAFAQLLPK